MSRRIISSSVALTDVITTSNTSSIKIEDVDNVVFVATITEDTPAAKTFVAGVLDVNTYTFPTQADSTGGDYSVVYSQDGSAWAIWLDKSGADAAPTGAIYTAIPAAKKGRADISGDTTAAQVAASVETAFNALTGFTALITTDDTAADGTMLFTQVVRGVTTAGVVKNADDSGAGSITVAETTAGVDSKVNVTTDTITVASHGLTTGLKGQLTSTATLPAGLSASTDYFVVVVNSSSFKLATSLANALAGTVVNITNQGTAAATHTFTATSIAGGVLKVQVSEDDSTFIDTDRQYSITDDGSVVFEYPRSVYNYIRLQGYLTAGRFQISSTVKTFKNP